MPILASTHDDASETIACQSVLDALNAQIAILDQNGVIIAANRAWFRSVAARSGDRLFRIGACYRDDWTAEQSIFAAVAPDAPAGIDAVLRGEQLSFVREYCRQTEAGERWFRLEALPLRQGGVALVNTDITAQQALEALAHLRERHQRLQNRLRRRRRLAHAPRQSLRLLIEQTTRLARANAELQQFTSVVSHELREPLRMVSSFLDLLRRRYGEQLDERANEYIAYAYDGAMRMQSLIEKLLAYARLDQRRPAMRPVDCNDVLARAIGMLQVAIAESQADITFDPLPTVLGDDVELGLVFRNLISNAIKFCGDERPRIHIGAQRRTNEWLFTVRDHGIGIPASDAERIFDMFVRGQSRRQYPGSGIGLAICRKVITRHGGRIWVERPADGGSLFCFTLPALP
ncbi:MAG: ATP-binding protein [Roseiflexus sp.]|nr:ATP-binding protein [Roseiflexus sp.]MCS7287601.1 ATP-binding protein [Roseiflexus sp.]MDW8147705.1 ATP-binding protein [Roseiflexaceae bacterium]MDW8233998.1 ATP-binding protein [Roseiflexaceae bacterium]